jgi:hypothetical protein
MSDKILMVGSFKGIAEDHSGNPIFETPESKLWRCVFLKEMDKSFKISTASKIADKALEEYKKRVY